MSDLQRDLSINESANSQAQSQSSNIFKPKKSRHPESEGFWEMLYYNVTPHLTPISFSVLLSVIYIVMFVIQLCIAGIRLEGQFLESNLESITYDLAMEVSLLEKEENAYRVLSYHIVHSDLPSLIFSILMLYIWVSGIEVQIGLIRSALIYFFSAITGVLFALPVADEGVPIMGGNVGIFGLVGASIGYLLLNWFRIKNKGLSKFIMIIFVAGIIAFGFLLAQNILSPMLMTGGVISGFFLGCCLSPKIEDKDGNEGNGIHELVIILVGAIVYVVLFASLMTTYIG